MTLLQDTLLTDEIHPIDIVETLATTRAWEVDRVTDDQIAMAVEGQWRNYAITLAWSPVDETLRLMCTFEMEPPEGRMSELYEALNLTNDMVWGGNFTYWAAQRLMVWRYGLLLSGAQMASAEQIDDMVQTALGACERFYPAFQLVAWAERAPDDALQVAIGQTYGRA